MNPTDTICRDLWAYPVINLDIPLVRTCCKRAPKEIEKTVLTSDDIERLGTDLFLNYPSIVSDRLAAMSGIQVPECKTCWMLENNGLKSFRLGAPDTQFHFNNISGKPVTDDEFVPFDTIIEKKNDYLLSDKPNKLDLMLGTYCDLKCLYCNEFSSSQWDTENRKFGRIWNRPLKHNHTKPIIIAKDKGTIGEYFDLFIKWFENVYEHLERIALLGGEPTMSPYFDLIVDHLVTKLKHKHHPNCSINIVTNLNWKKSVLDKIISLANELPNIKIVIEVSMESTAKKAEYIRHGVTWERFVDNFKKIANISTIEIVPVLSVNALCVSSLLDYFKFLHEMEKISNRSYRILFNQVVYPRWLSFDILSDSHTHYITDVINWVKENIKNNDHIISCLNDLITIMQTEKDPALISYFSQWIQTMDYRRNTKFSEVFPEFANIIHVLPEYVDGEYDDALCKKWI